MHCRQVYIWPIADHIWMRSIYVCHSIITNGFTPASTSSLFFSGIPTRRPCPSPGVGHISYLVCPIFLIIHSWHAFSFLFLLDFSCRFDKPLHTGWLCGRFCSLFTIAYAWPESSMTLLYLFLYLHIAHLHISLYIQANICFSLPKSDSKIPKLVMSHISISSFRSDLDMMAGFFFYFFFKYWHRFHNLADGLEKLARLISLADIGSYESKHNPQGNWY